MAKSLTFSESEELAQSLRNEFNKYADIMGIGTVKRLPPDEGYTIALKINGDTSWSFVEEVRDAARLKAGDIPVHVQMSNHYPAKKRNPDPTP
jgi:hypothetical protein